MNEVVESERTQTCEAFVCPNKPANVSPEKRCYTVEELCAILGVSRGYVYDLLKQKAFRWFRLGTTGRYRISKVDFDAWLERNI